MVHDYNSDESSDLLSLEYYKHLPQTIIYITAMNPFGVADSYIEAGYHVVMVDLDGVRKQGLDPAHVVGCQVLGAPCTNGYLRGLETEQFEVNTEKHDIIGHPFTDLSVEDVTKMEQLFLFRDWYVLPFESCKNALS
jgi:hypothetical protein